MIKEEDKIFINQTQLNKYKELSEMDQLEIKSVVAKIHLWLKTSSPSEFVSLYSLMSLELIQSTSYPQITNACYHAERLGLDWN